MYNTFKKYESLDSLRKFCRKSMVKDLPFPDVNNEKFDHLKSILLVVVFNRPHHYNIPMFQILYEPWFKKVVYCSTFNSNPYNFSQHQLGPVVADEQQQKFAYINVTDNEFQSGYFGYNCAVHAILSEASEKNNFLIIADDLLLNFWNSININSVHLHNDCRRVSNDSGTSSVWWDSKFGRTALEKVKKILSNNDNLLTKELSSKEMKIFHETLMDSIWCPSDIYFIPNSVSKKFQKLAEIFSSSKVFLEFAIPKMLSVLGWYEYYQRLDRKNTLTVVPDFDGKYLWNMSFRASPFSFYNKNLLFLHPVKFTLLHHSSWKTNFCNFYVFDLFKSLSDS